MNGKFEWWDGGKYCKEDWFLDILSLKINFLVEIELKFVKKFRRHSYILESLGE